MLFLNFFTLAELHSVKYKTSVDRSVSLLSIFYNVNAVMINISSRPTAGVRDERTFRLFLWGPIHVFIKAPDNNCQILLQ